MKKISFVLFCLLALSFSIHGQKRDTSLLNGYTLSLIPNVDGKPTLNMFIRDSDWLIGFCDQYMQVVTEPCFFEAYSAVPSSDYPLIAVCDNKTKKWGFYCVSIGRGMARYYGQLVYKCVFDEIAYESLEQPFYDGTAVVKYQGKWITLDIERDKKNKSPLLDH